MMVIRFETYGKYETGFWPVVFVVLYFAELSELSAFASSVWAVY